MKMKTLLCFWLTASLVYCQINVRGRVLSEQHTPLEEANVNLVDSLGYLVSGAISDSKGDFRIQNQSGKKCSLLISLLGYKTVSVVLSKDRKDEIDLGSIVLKKGDLELKEVTVQGKKVIQRAESELYYPSVIQQKTSKNGIDLLGNLAIRGLHVNSIDMSVNKITGEKVQVRINNVRASSQQVRALRPENIVRVNYMDAPVGAYAEEGVDAVINIITRNPQSGGVLYADLSNALTTGLSNNTLVGAFNTKSSEIAFNYFLGLRDYRHTKQEGEDRFYLSDNSTYSRIREGIDQPYRYTQHVITGSYQLQKANNYMFNALFTTEIVHNHADRRNWLERNSASNEELLTQTKVSNPYNKPILDLYLEKNLPKSQKLILDMVGTYWNETYHSNYIQSANNVKQLEYNTDVDGKKRSLIVDASYTNDWQKNGKLEAGIQHTQAYSNNKYTGTTNAVADMNQAKSYIYANYSNRINKLSLNIGAGATRSYFSQSNNHYKYYNFKPSLLIKWNINDNHTVTNRFRVLNNNPSLGQLSNVTTMIDSIQSKRGNPDLKPYNIYANSLLYSFSKNKIAYNAELSYKNQQKPIMENYTVESNTLISSFDNQKSWIEWKAETQITWSSIANFLNITLGGGYLSQHSNGNDYSHAQNSFYGFSTVAMLYKDFSFSANFKTRTKSVYGESYSRISPDLTLQMAYTKDNKLTFGLNFWNPFMKAMVNRFEVKSKLTNQFEKITYRDNGNVVIIRFAYVFSLGRQFNTIDKSKDNKDAESGIMK